MSADPIAAQHMTAVQNALQRVREASTCLELVRADPSADGDDRDASRALYESAVRQFGDVWRDVDYLLERILLS